MSKEAIVGWSSGKSMDPSPSRPVKQLGSTMINNNTQCNSHVPQKKHHFLGKRLEPLNLDACVVCNVVDELVLRCRGTGCLLSFHSKCMDKEAVWARPYCSYCWFKVLAGKSNALAEDVAVAREAASKFIDEETTSKDDAMDKVFSGDDNENQDKVESSKDRGGLRVGNDKVIYDVESSDDEERRVAVQNLQGGKDDKRAKVTTGAGNKGDVSSFLSVEESFSEKEQDNQNEKQSRRRRLILNDTDSEHSSNRQNGEEDGTDQITSSTQVTSRPGQRKVNPPTKVAKSKPGRDVSFFNKDHQRRALWTDQEEKTLKEGVERFAAKANKNMPWRKILEWGGSMFNESRTPADLKDKWRNMMRKASKH